MRQVALSAAGADLLRGDRLGLGRRRPRWRARCSGHRSSAAVPRTKGRPGPWRTRRRAPPSAGSPAGVCPALVELVPLAARDGVLHARDLEVFQLLLDADLRGAGARDLLDARLAALPRCRLLAPGSACRRPWSPNSRTAPMHWTAPRTRPALRVGSRRRRPARRRRHQTAADPRHSSGACDAPVLVGARIVPHRSVALSAEGLALVRRMPQVNSSERDATPGCSPRYRGRR